MNPFRTAPRVFRVKARMRFHRDVKTFLHETGSGVYTREGVESMLSWLSCVFVV